jgi:hypothetical protein
MGGRGGDANGVRGSVLGAGTFEYDFPSLLDLEIRLECYRGACFPLGEFRVEDFDLFPLAAG